MESIWSVLSGSMSHVFDMFHFVGSMYSMVLEYVLLLMLLIAFIYHLYILRQDHSLWADMMKWASSSIGAVFIILICLYMSPAVFADDQTMWRYIIIRVVGICIGVVGISGALLFIDSVTKGDWLGHIEQTEYGPTIVIASMILALSIIIVYA